MNPYNSIQIILFSLLFQVVFSQDYEFPDYQIDVYEPKGFKISIPDTEGVTLFAVHININKEMEYLEAGQIARDVVKKRGNRWVYEDKNLRLKQGDKLYFWLYVIYERLGYRLDNQEYTVKDFTARGGSPDPGPSPTLPTIGSCQTSSTLVSGKQVCRDQVVFFEQFNDRVVAGGTLKNWITEIHIPRTPDSFFTVFDNKNLKVENGQLIILPTLLEDTYGDNFIKTGHLTLNGCTSEIKSDCDSTGFSWNIVPPILSSRVNTRDSFSFKYGILEVRAKLPKGDWIVPEIWMIGKSQGPNPDKIFVAKSLGNVDLTFNGKKIGGQRLSQGVTRDGNKTLLFSRDRSDLWSDEFHIYKLRWTPDSVRFLVDDTEVGMLDSAPFTREGYISIGVHVGGLEDFPDDSINRGNLKPWKNGEIRNSINFWQGIKRWDPFWNDNSKLLVDYVKVTAI